METQSDTEGPLLSIDDLDWDELAAAAGRRANGVAETWHRKVTAQQRNHAMALAAFGGVDPRSWSLITGQAAHSAIGSLSINREQGVLQQLVGSTSALEQSVRRQQALVANPYVHLGLPPALHSPKLVAAGLELFDRWRHGPMSGLSELMRLPVPESTLATSQSRKSRTRANSHSHRRAVLLKDTLAQDIARDLRAFDSAHAAVIHELCEAVRADRLTIAELMNRLETRPIVGMAAWETRLWAVLSLCCAVVSLSQSTTLDREAMIEIVRSALRYILGAE